MQDEPILSAAGVDILPALLPECECQVLSTRAVVLRKFYGRRRLILYVEVVGGPHDGTPLWWCANLPELGRRPGISSKFFRAWTLVTGRRPYRGERLSHQMLVGKLFRAQIATVSNWAERGPDGKPFSRSPALQYSIVRTLIERVA